MPNSRLHDRPFLSVSETAYLLGMSEMTLYRAIADGGFPAVRIRGRLIVPARAIDEMVDAALADRRVVDAAAWVPQDYHRVAGGDRGSVPVGPLLAFAGVLFVVSVMAHGSLVGLVSLLTITVGLLVVLVVRSVRRERRLNRASIRLLEARHLAAVDDQRSGVRR